MLPLFSVYVHAHAWEGIQVHVCALESGGQSVPRALATYSLSFRRLATSPELTS